MLAVVTSILPSAGLRTEPRRASSRSWSRCWAEIAGQAKDAADKCNLHRRRGLGRRLPITAIQVPVGPQLAHESCRTAGRVSEPWMTAETGWTGRTRPVVSAACEDEAIQPIVDEMSSLSPITPVPPERLLALLPSQCTAATAMSDRTTADTHHREGVSHRAMVRAIFRGLSGVAIKRPRAEPAPSSAEGPEAFPGPGNGGRGRQLGGATATWSSMFREDSWRSWIGGSEVQNRVILASGRRRPPRAWLASGRIASDFGLAGQNLSAWQSTGRLQHWR